jgi:hypothetical protein
LPRTETDEVADSMIEAPPQRRLPFNNRRTVAHQFDRIEWYVKKVPIHQNNVLNVQKHTPYTISVEFLCNIDYSLS